MSCEYTLNGKTDPTHTELFNYIANNKERSADEVYRILREAGIAIKKNDAGGNPRMYLVMGTDSSVNYKRAQNINVGARVFFGIPQNERLLEYTNLGTRSNKFTGVNTLFGLRINESVLRKMESPQQQYENISEILEEEARRVILDTPSPFRDDYLLSEAALQANNSERSKFSKMAQNSVDNTIKQITKLKQAFKNADIDVEVRLDGDIEEKGMLLPASEGSPNPVILLNPNKITEDTVYHEFAHLFIDLLGYNHPLVQQAIKELRGSELYQEVLDYYPELEGDTERLDKEVLATAIGLEGARMEKKAPNKLQSIINRIFRAIGKLLGVSQDAVSQLAVNMIVNEIDVTQFRGALSSYAQMSKAERNVKNIVETLREKTQTAILQLESLPFKNEAAINELKLQQSKLETVTEVEGLIDFVNYTTRLAARAETTFENILTEYSSNPALISGEKRLQMLQQLHQVHQWLQAFHNNTSKNGSTLTAIKLELRKKTSAVEASGGNITELTAFKNRLADAIDVLDELDEKYAKVGIPILADLLLEYNKPQINDKIDAAIEKVRVTGREFGLKRRTPEFRELQRQLKEGEITREEFNAAKIELNIKHLQARKIGRETIIRELTESQKNKSWLSYMMDPVIYSSQPAIQLFAGHVKAALYRAADKFRETKYELRDIYREYAASRPGAEFDDAAFNEPILETYTYEVIDWEETKKTGEHVTKRMNLLSFVQPYDVGKYYQAETDAITSLAKKYNRPTDPDDLKAWTKSKKATQYYTELSQWYAENSVMAEDAQERYDALISKRKALQVELEQALQVGNSNKVGLLEAEIVSLSTQIGAAYDFRAKQFKGSFARPNDKYKSEKYEKLVKDKSSVEYRYYKALLDEYKKSQKKLGRTNQVRNSWNDFSYILPTVRKSTLNKTIEGASSIDVSQVVSAGRDMIKDTYEILETDTDYGVLVGLNGERLQTVPVFFTNPVDEKDVSKDALGSILKFTHMSNMFEEKSKILGSVEMMRSVIEQRGTLEQDESGNPAFNKVTAKLKNMAKRVVTQDPKKDPDNQFRHLSEFIDSVFYGEKDLKNQLNASIRLFGKDIDISGNKLSQTATTLTAATSLIGNKLQAVNQIIMDNERLIEEGIAGEYFGKVDLAWAKGEYYKNLLTLKTLKDAGSFAKDNKMLQAAELLDALSDLIDSNGDRVTGARLKKYLSFDTGFFMQNMAEHETAITRMLAVTRGYKGKLKDAAGNVILNEKNEPADLYDLLVKDKKGMLTLDPRVANVSLYDVRSTLAGLQKKSNQLKGSVDRSMAERRAAGKMVTLFRRFLAPGFRRHWGHGGLANVSFLHVDTETGMLSEGAYWTTFKYIRDQVQSIATKQPANVWNFLTTDEKANVRRTAAQSTFFLSSMILSGLLMGAAAEEDDEEKAAQYIFWAYQARRLQTELGAFLSPKEVYNITKSPSAASRPIMNIYNLITHIVFKELPYALGADGLEKDIFYQRKSGEFEKGDRKVIKKIRSVIPVWSGLNKNAEEAIKWFDLNG